MAISSFINNPVIAGLGAQLGMGDMFNAMRGANPPAGDPSPSGSPPPPPPSPAGDPAQNTDKPGKSAPNVPEYKNRPYIPRNEMGAGGVKPGSTSGLNPTTPGTMDPATLQDPNVLSLLGQYGVHPSTTPPDPNLFIHNPATFQNHPIFAGLLEHGLEGLAYSHPGPNFLQSLVGGAQGIQEANAARAAQVNAQTMAPIQQASAIQALQQKYDEHVTSQDNVAYHQGMLKYYQDVADNKRDHYLDTRPQMNAETGEMMSLQPDANNPTGYSWKVDPTLGRDEEKYQRSQAVSGAIQDIANKKYNGDLSKVTPVERLKAITDQEAAESLAKGASAQVVGAGHDRARTASASIRGTGSGRSGAPAKMNPGDSLNWKDLDTQDKEITKQLGDISNAQHTYQDPNGNMLLVGSKAYKDRVANLASQQQQLRSQKQAITSRYTKNMPQTQAPALSSDNPFNPANKK